MARRKHENLILVNDEFFSYRRLYYEEGLRVDDYNDSAFYQLYNGIWENPNAGYNLSDLVAAGLKDPNSWEAQLLTYELRLTDWTNYTFDEWEALYQKRREAAKKGWITRRKHLEVKRKRSEAAKRGWEKRRDKK